MPSDPGDVTDAAELVANSDGVVDLSALREASTRAGDPLEAAEAATENDGGASLEEVLWQYREAILDLNARLIEVESRPQFAASLRGRRTGH